MTANLRKRHRNISLFVFPSLLAFYGYAMYSRQADTVGKKLPKKLRAKIVNAGMDRPLHKGKLLLKKKQMQLKGISTVMRTWKQGNRYWLSLHLKTLLDMRPDLLLYWQSQKSKQLTPSAYLLGSWKNRKEIWFSLPENFLHNRGEFILYSLGHAKVVTHF